ncbi:hypothetical protein HZF24_06425 [Sedimentibacter hydroxybenzoicus DSM 7310]|uniref:Uncharacterized protein n=1 Tax=Sedimentibacter hydroxybenzoicus DSM 7310 TaxID=1123245 RepID=A0A974BJG5_SEDHY|nr:hypothetical protein [Sedimentibacter hydroxybenzoicus]NYB73775.1 hypothetical protein [Sedimentibacter hydroxybenzoicus DSM 7310]
MSVNLVPAVIAVKAGKDKAGQNAIVHQVAQITTKCCYYNVEIVEGFVSFGGLKDIKKEAIKIFEKKAYRYLMIYSPTQFTQNEKEYREFVEELEQFYNIHVKQLRP